MAELENIHLIDGHTWPDDSSLLALLDDLVLLKACPESDAFLRPFGDITVSEMCKLLENDSKYPTGWACWTLRWFMDRFGPKSRVSLLKSVARNQREAAQLYYTKREQLLAEEKQVLLASFHSQYKVDGIALYPHIEKQIENVERLG